MPVVVGCKLPNGFAAEVGDVEVKFNGLNTTNVIGGFGITEGVSEEFWKAWLDKHQDMPFVKNGFIFAHSNNNSLKAEIKEKAKEKTGLEPLDPSKKPAGIEQLEK